MVDTPPHSEGAGLILRGRINFYSVEGDRSEKNAGGPSVLIAYGLKNLASLYTSGIAGKFIALKNG